MDSVVLNDMKQSISTTEAMHWIAKMAAKDGVISQNERKLLKEFANRYQIDINKLYRMAYALAKETEQEVELTTVNEIKGRRFEEFVVSLFADKTIFKLLAWRSDKIVGNTYASENLYPDLHIRHKLSTKTVEYFIECKYRSYWRNDEIDLSTQFTRYCDYAKKQKCDLFIALGVGGTPTFPNEFYIIPASAIPPIGIITKAHIEKHLCKATCDTLTQLINHLYNK